MRFPGTGVSKSLAKTSPGLESDGVKLDKNAILKTLKQLENMDIESIKTIIGFDGFVDEVVHVVKKRHDSNSYVREATLTDYGNRIAATAGYSSNVEIVTVSQKLGGNGPILANSLMKLGFKINYIGALGYPTINPVFEDMKKGCENLIPICQPASTDAVEFEDGKIIRSKLSAFNELTFENIKKRVGLNKLAQLMDESDLIGLENWALPPYSGDIWQGILDEVIPVLKEETKDKVLFFDLADPASRMIEDLQKALKTIKEFTKHYCVVLGLNLSEAVQVAGAFGQTIKKDESNLNELCSVIMQNMKIDTLVIHPVKASCCISGGKYYYQDGPFCPDPKLTTGAGDNFNAGFVFGVMQGFDYNSCLVLGMANSGFYVRNAKSADVSDLRKFLKQWSENKI